MKVLALTHGPSVGPGVFADTIREAGHELEEWAAPFDGHPPRHDALLVLGGGMHPDEDAKHPWLAREQAFLVDALEREVPVLGVCLGAQMLARAAGASVSRAPEPEIGWYPVELTEPAAADPLFRDVPQRFDAFEWHHYTYALPEGAVELARSGACTQAFRLGSAWGIQFHAEVTEEQVVRWLEEEPADVADPAAFRAEVRRRIGTWNGFGRALSRRFADVVALRP
ncbi:MAG TPA: type 1 glutamine amidotransferase [Gaiellaceae bacterium]|nr:type 1 glutamine amidotransferase [Gaiellaceae bacterium]